MIIDISMFLILGVLTGVVAYLSKRLAKAEKQIINLALRVTDIGDLANKVDRSTGTALYELKKEFKEFKADYGDAAIEEMKESAKAQKAFADGLGSIMNYGANLYGRGDAK